MRSILLTLLLVPFLCSAKDTLVLLAGYSIPPYIIVEENRGIELDICRAAFAKSGYYVKPIYVPSARLRLNFSENSVDGALTTNESSGLVAYYSDEYICFQNTAITLKENNFRIDSIPDLAGKSIVAWQDASIYSGDLYNKTIKSASEYVELSNQVSQVGMLFAQRCDVIIIDVNIFRFLLPKVTLVPVDKPVTVHPIFPLICYKVAFKAPKLAELFNSGLKELKETGEYEKILYRYIKSPGSQETKNNK